MGQVSAESLFARSWQLLTRNWSIVVPGLIVAIVAGIATTLLLPTFVYADDAGVAVVQRVGGFRTFLALVIQLIAAIISITYTTGMAAAAWARGRATFADGAAAFRSEGGRVLGALLALFVVFILAAILAPFTLGLSLLAFFFLFVYAMPAAVIGDLGDLGGFGALGASYRIATRAFGTTAIVIIVLTIVFIVAGLVGSALGVVPFLGPLISELIGQAAVAYFTLVIVGEYLAARTRAGG